MELNFSNWQLFLDQQLDYLYKSSDLLNQFKASKTNYQRIDFVYFFNSIIEKYLESINFADDQKSDEISELYRKKGNDFYAKKDSQNALNNYNLALLYAPHNSKSLFLAYSNRSAVFYDLNMLENCLDDLSSCELHFEKNFKNDKSNSFFNLILKLIKRKVNCLIETKQNEILSLFRDSSIFQNFVKTARDLNKISELREINNLIDQNLKQNSRITDQLICNENKNFKNFINDSVDIEFSNKKGRHCLAKDDIKVGEVLFIEKAYCAILLPSESIKYCDLCFKSIYNDQNRGFEFLNIHPCDQCCCVFYCSNICKTQSQLTEYNYHKFECGFLKSMLHNLGLAHLAYRILSSTNQELILKYSNIQKMNNYINNVMKIDYKNDTNENNYCQVFYLLTHECSTHVDDLFKYSLTSLLLGKKFQKILDNDSSENLKLVSSLILRHLLQCICNAHAITHLKDDCNNQQTFSRDQQRYATAIYPRVSLLNHSCNSNVVSSFKENSNTIVVKASRAIKKSDEIFNSYGPHYIKMTYMERKQSLREQYHFDCDCSECVNQSKLFNERKLTGLRCFGCKGIKVFSAGKVANGLECSDCGKKIDLLTYIRKFDSVNSFLDSIDPECLSDENTKDIINKLEDLVSDCRRYLCFNENLELDKNVKIDSNMKIYYLDFSKLIDLLARLNCNLRNLLYGCSLLEKNVKLLEFIYDTKQNEVNIELGHEFFKLSELQCAIEEYQKALYSIDRAISIGQCVYSKESGVMKEYFQVKNYIRTFLKK